MERKFGDEYRRYGDSEKKLSLGGQRQFSQKKSGIRTQESGVAEYACKVFIRKSGTGLSPGNSPPESQIL